MNVWIIEDEEAAARRLEKLVTTIDPSMVITRRMDSIIETLTAIQEGPLPDLLFLDIQLADGLSFEIFNHTKIDKPIIFTTAYDQYAIQAFKVNAIDYLLKPIKKVELERSIQKFKDWANTETFNYGKLAEILKKDKPSQRFLLKVGQRLRLVDTADAAYFFSEDKITFLVDWKGQRFALDQSLEKLEDSLDPDQFFRVNRQFIIHLKSIGEMIAYSKSRVKILLDPNTKPEVVVSTERSPHFKRWLTGDR
ncbi:MAG: LytTR family DNA-binding domain-containing protein [Saprospiraceae bacterium]|nr:LytTR family DNA-binding domain-containing protein [Saprospiraceae bacterium]